MPFPCLYRAIGHADAIAFVDVEASQYSFQLLSFGMSLVGKKRDTLSFSEDESHLSSFVRYERKVRIGKKVEELTHIHPDDLLSGIPLSDLNDKIISLLSSYERVCLVSYGELDKKVIGKNFRTLEDSFLKRYPRFFDFHSYLKKSLYPKRGCSYSISGLLSLFSLEDVSMEKHKALDDALALERIVCHFVRNEDEVRKLICEKRRKENQDDGVLDQTSLEREWFRYL